MTIIIPIWLLWCLAPVAVFLLFLLFMGAVVFWNTFIDDGYRWW